MAINLRLSAAKQLDYERVISTFLTGCLCDVFGPVLGFVLSKNDAGERSFYYMFNPGYPADCLLPSEHEVPEWGCTVLDLSSVAAFLPKMVPWLAPPTQPLDWSLEMTGHTRLTIPTHAGLVDAWVFRCRCANPDPGEYDGEWVWWNPSSLAIRIWPQAHYGPDFRLGVGGHAYLRAHWGQAASANWGRIVSAFERLVTVIGDVGLIEEIELDIRHAEYVAEADWVIAAAQHLPKLRLNVVRP